MTYARAPAKETRELTVKLQFVTIDLNSGRVASAGTTAILVDLGIFYRRQRGGVRRTNASARHAAAETALARASMASPLKHFVEWNGNPWRVRYRRPAVEAADRCGILVVDRTEHAPPKPVKAQ
jgi:hypothetical protein